MASNYRDPEIERSARWEVEGLCGEYNGSAVHLECGDYWSVRHVGL